MSLSDDLRNGPESAVRQAFEHDKARLVAALTTAAGQPPTLSKKTSNLFRSRNRRHSRKLPRVALDRVLRVEAEAGWAEVCGMTPYESFVRDTLPFGVMPAVVPELKSITVGGAIAGGGIESSSFKYGYVHETVLAMEIVTGSGEVVYCTADNEHRDLFFGFANSYGTLGYVLRAWMRVIPVKPYVRLRHEIHRQPAEGLALVARLCAANRGGAGECDFIDASWFGPKDGMVVTTATFVDKAPQVSDYKGRNIYYKSLLQRDEDWLRTEDYIWRWDTDWFWCSRAFGMENRLLRALFSACGALRSTTYWKIRAWLGKCGYLTLMQRIKPHEFIIQDVEIPAHRSVEFLKFFDIEIGILPVWICPAQSADASALFSLFQVDGRALYLNFGFWSSVASKHPPGHYNRLIERKVTQLGGKKSLYSDSFFPEDEFWEIYNRPAYQALKHRYDPHGRLRDLYQKCVKGL